MLCKDNKINYKIEIFYNLFFKIDIVAFYISIYKDMKRFSQIQNDWLEINNYLYKKFEFGDFDSSIDFVNKVAKIANELKHHPTIIINYNIVEIKTTTHDRGDIITKKDFELVEEIEKI